VIDHFHRAWTDLTGPGGPFELTTATIDGRTVRVYRHAPANLRQLWERSAEFGDRPYVVFEDERHTYDDIHRQVRALAQVLRDRFDIGGGDRVAVAMRNYPEWIVSHWAITALGATTVGCNAWWTGAELEYGLLDSRPRVLIADDERLERVLPHLDAVRAAMALHVISVRSERDLPADADRWDDVVDAAGAPDTLPPAVIEPDDELCVFYTSGTTGTPKGAVLTHCGSVTNVLNCQFMAAAAYAGAQRAAGGPPTPPEPPVGAPPPVVLVSTPLFHVTACHCLLHPGTLAGNTLVFMYKWDAGRALELVERERVTSLSGVPVMSREVLAHADWERRDTSSLAGMGGGGAAFHPDLVAKVDAALPNGLPSTGYGLTETTGVVTSNFGPTCLLKPASCGPVVPTLDARLVDEAGAEMPTGTGSVGRLQVRGAVVFAGYLNRPEATEDVLADGWFDTGDVAFIDDDGFVHLVDRAKDMVNRGGEMISCGEVETAIHEALDVAEVAVFAVPDERLGEEVAAVLVPQRGVTLEPAAVAAALAGRIAAHKVPSRVWVRHDPLPRNANGKFLKRQLRDDYAVPPAS
jgi:acyl-CoA synthetase (AMP-forming)/AMP-acid ligase II